ncbi:MAG TPA: hypothetical protein VEJ41_05990 [Candidatus Acidoferrales bacterium]|nr:hypothetical protein [Candidatus Acidoferrales bacterium]
MSRIRQQVFLVGLMVAFTALSSAMAPIAIGQGLRHRADAQRRRIVGRTRRRIAGVRAFVRRRTRPALAFLSRTRNVA